MEDNLLSVSNILNRVAANPSKLQKEAIIRNNKDNELFAAVLNHIFNPFVITNIAKKKFSRQIKVEESITIKNSYEYMDYLAHSSGRDVQIGMIQAYINSQPPELRELLVAMATKELKIGATSSTINKAFGFDFIPTFDVMLAEKYIETKKVKEVKKVYEHWKRYVGEKVIATKKLDGNRCAVLVNSKDNIELYSREGHKLEGFVELENAFSQYPVGEVYDGEILATNEEGLNSKDLFQKTSKIMRRKGDKVGVEFHAFDILPISEFTKGGFATPCEKRKESLKHIIETHPNKLIKNVDILYIGEFDKQVIDALAEEAKANEDEGVMVQLAEAPYSCKRTFDILKVKVFESADLRCLDIYEGKKDSTAGMLGGIVLDYKGHHVNVGGGFSRDQRILLWKNPELIKGEIVEITFFEEFEDEEGNLDLRFAQFKTIRTDKTEPSYY